MILELFRTCDPHPPIITDLFLTLDGIWVIPHTAEEPLEGVVQCLIEGDGPNLAQREAINTIVRQRGYMLQLFFPLPALS